MNKPLKLEFGAYMACGDPLGTENGRNYSLSGGDKAARKFVSTEIDKAFNKAHRYLVFGEPMQ